MTASRPPCELENEGRWALRPPGIPSALEVAADCVDDPNYYLVALSRSPAMLNGPWAAQTVPGQALDGLLLARSTLAVGPHERGRGLAVPYAPGNPLLFPVKVTEDGSDKAGVRAEVTISGERLGSVNKKLRSDLFDPNGTVYWETFEVPVPEPLRADIRIGSAGEPLRLARDVPLEPAPTDWRLRPGEGQAWAVFSSPPLTVTAHGVPLPPRAGSARQGSPAAGAGERADRAAGRPAAAPPPRRPVSASRPGTPRASLAWHRAAQGPRQRQRDAGAGDDVALVGTAWRELAAADHRAGCGRTALARR